MGLGTVVRRVSLPGVDVYDSGRSAICEIRRGMNKTLSAFYALKGADLMSYKALCLCKVNVEIYKCESSLEVDVVSPKPDDLLLDDTWHSLRLQAQCKV